MTTLFQSSGLSFLMVAATLLGTAGLGGLLKTLLDHQRGKRKQTDDVAMELVKLLEERVGRLEQEASAERARCDERLERQAVEYNHKLAQNEAEMGVLRHRVNNQRMMIYSLLHLFEVPATRRKEQLDGIRKNLAAMEQAEAVEKAIVASAPIKAEPAE